MKIYRYYSIALAIIFLIPATATFAGNTDNAPEICTNWLEEDEFAFMERFPGGFGECVGYVRTWPVEHCKWAEETETDHFTEHHKNFGQCVKHHRPFIENVPWSVDEHHHDHG